jgi:hypothetical protein
MAMCQDVDFHVGIAMCEQLQSIGKSVGSDMISGVILNELLELLKDEDMKVQTLKKICTAKLKECKLLTPYLKLRQKQRSAVTCVKISGFFRYQDMPIVLHVRAAAFSSLILLLEKVNSGGADFSYMKSACAPFDLEKSK